MSIQVIHGDCIKEMQTMAADSIHCVVTSPPYWGLRDYGTEFHWNDGTVEKLG